MERGILLEPINILCKEFLRHIDIRIRTAGGGNRARILAARCSISRSILKYITSSETLRENANSFKKFMIYSRSLIAVSFRKCESKKVGFRGSRSAYQKSF